MRDPKRINEITEKLNQYWNQHPDLRFGQLFESLKRLGDLPDDPFFIEDDKWINILNSELKNNMGH